MRYPYETWERKVAVFSTKIFPIIFLNKFLLSTDLNWQKKNQRMGKKQLCRLFDLFCYPRDTYLFSRFDVEEEEPKKVKTAVFYMRLFLTRVKVLLFLVFMIGNFHRDTLVGTACRLCSGSDMRIIYCCPI
jgi:hypothetical protein